MFTFMSLALSLFKSSFEQHIGCTSDRVGGQSQINMPPICLNTIILFWKIQNKIHQIYFALTVVLRLLHKINLLPQMSDTFRSWAHIGSECIRSVLSLIVYRPYSAPIAPSLRWIGWYGTCLGPTWPCGGSWGSPYWSCLRSGAASPSSREARMWSPASTTALP